MESKAVFFLGSNDQSGQIITTSADVTLNGGLIRELPQNPLNSGLGIILICPDQWQKRSRFGESLFVVLLMVQKSGSPVDMVLISHYWQGFIYVRWLAGFLNHQQ